MLPDESRPLIDDRSPAGARKARKSKAGKAGPRFIFVNDRTPRGHPHCASCCTPLNESYVREVGSGLIYCGTRCSTKRSRRMSDLASQFRAWVVS